MGATLAIGALTLAAPIPTQHAVTGRVLGAGILRGRSRHTRSYSKDSCGTGGFVSRSPPAIHKNSLFLKMSVARHIGPDIFLLLTVVGFWGWVGFCAGGELQSLFDPVFSYLYCLSCFFVLLHASCSIKGGKGGRCWHASEFPLSTHIFLLNKFLTLPSLSANAILFHLPRLTWETSLLQKLRLRIILLLWFEAIQQSTC